MNTTTKHSAAAIRATSQIHAKGHEYDVDGMLVMRYHDVAAIIDAEIQPLVEALRNMLACAGRRCDTSVCYYCRTGCITVGEQAVDQARTALQRAEGDKR